MLALRILRDATQVAIFATYVILGGLVVAFPILYSMQEGLFALVRWEFPLANTTIQDSLFPMFATALLCVILRGLKYMVSAVIDRMTPGATEE